MEVRLLLQLISIWEFHLTVALVSGVHHWPVYNATGGYGQNFYLHPTDGGVRPDIFRLAGTAFMNSIAKEQYGR